MKYTVKIMILLGIFLGAIWFFGSNMDEAMFGSIKTAQMEEATLPTITLRSDGVTVNKLYGYTLALNACSVRENLVAVENDRTIELLIEENKTDVRKLTYKVYDVNTKAEVAKNTVSAFDKEEDRKKARLKIDSPLESGKEYAVELMLVDSKSRRIYYYFRVKSYENSEFAEKAEFIRTISEWAREKNYNAIIPYLESTYRGEGSTYAYVDIKDSFYMVCWGNLQPKLLTEPILTISEIYSNIAVATMKYMVEILTDTGTEQYYIEEKFRVIVSGDSKHLLNYERTMEAVFDEKLASLSMNQFKLGVTNETDMDLFTNSDASQLAFVRNKELWHYNMAENTLSKVFTFRKENEPEQGISCDQYDVRILKLYESGDISFMVYGHMGRGEYEGKTGIVLYRYDRNEKRIEEQLYFPVSESYQKIKEELGSFSYMNDFDVFFFMAYNTMYSYNLITKSLQVIADNAVTESVAFLRDSSYVVWQEKGYKDMELYHLESGERKKLTAKEGEFLRILGKIDENIICGYGLLSDCLVMGDGSLLYPAYEIKILDENLEEKKSYLKEGFYVTEAEITANSIRLLRVEKTTEGYEEATDDYILNSKEEIKRPVRLDKRITEKMFAEYYIDLPSTYEMKEIPISESVPYTLITEDTTVRVPALENEAEEYIVYSFGSIIDISESCAEAIRLANRPNVVGTVVNESGVVIWERGVRYSSYYLKELEGKPTKNSGLTTRQEAVRMMAAYLKLELDVTEFDETTSVKEYLENATGHRAISLTGVSLDEALYFVFRGIPIYAMKSRTEAVVITGYNASSVTVYEPSSGKYKVYAMKEAEDMFEKAGNIFLSYVK